MLQEIEHQSIQNCQYANNTLGSGWVIRIVHVGSYHVMTRKYIIHMDKRLSIGKRGFVRFCEQLLVTKCLKPSLLTLSLFAIECMFGFCVTGDGKSCFISRLIGGNFIENHYPTNALEAELRCEVKITKVSKAWKKHTKSQDDLIEDDFIEGLSQSLPEAKEIHNAENDRVNDDPSPSVRAEGDKRNDKSVNKTKDSDVQTFVKSNEPALQMPKAKVKHQSEKISEKKRMDNKQAEKRLSEMQKRKEKKEDSDCTIHVWDFGGDMEFYSLHQIFLRPRCVYALIVNLSRDLNSKRNAPLLPIHQDSMTYLQEIQFWLNTIQSHLNTGEAANSIVIIGTHKDLLPGHKEEAAEAYFTKLKSCLSSSHKKLVRAYIPVDSKNGDPVN